MLSIAAVSLHPTVRAASPEHLLQRVVVAGPMDEAVHGTLIAFLAALTYGFCIFVLTQRRSRALGLAGLVCYVSGAGALTVAALIDGFFTPAFAGANVHASGGALPAVIAVLAAGALAIQIATKLGLLAFSGAILLWAPILLAAGGLARYGAAVAAVAAAATIAIVAFGPHHLNPHSLLVIVLGQAVWYVTAGLALLTLERASARD